jgi:hypothetical protein
MTPGIHRTGADSIPVLAEIRAKKALPLPPWDIAAAVLSGGWSSRKDLIKLFAAISGVQSRFEAQEVELLAVSELPARLKIDFQCDIGVCPGLCSRCSPF